MNKFKERAAYRFDRVMSKGVGSMIAMLAAATAVTIVVIALVIVICGFTEDGGAGAPMWDSFATVINSWVLYSGDGSPGYVAVMAVAALCGVFITSLLIGILTSAIEEKVQSLRCGNSHVLERGHAVIVGFSDGIYRIVSELCAANKTARGFCIVVLGDKDKPEMEELLREHADIPHNVRVVCRKGESFSAAALNNCAVCDSKFIIINEIEDHRAIKAIMAVSSLLGGCSRKERPRIICAVRDRRSLLPARIAGGENADILLASDLIARLIAHTARQPGISEAFTELFGFTGNEFYIEHIPALVGAKFEEAGLRLTNAALLGIYRGAEAMLNPSGDTRILPDDGLIVIAQSEGTAAAAPAAADFRVSAAVKGKSGAPRSPEHILVIGYNDTFLPMLKELSLPDSLGDRLTVAGVPDGRRAETEEAVQEVWGLTASISGADVFDRAELETLVLDGVDHVLILSDRELSPEQADGNTMLLLLHLRDIKHKYGAAYSITSEMNLITSQSIARSEDITDFIISGEITGLVVAQAAVNPMLIPVFKEILSDEGSEFHLVEVERFISQGHAVTVGAIAAAMYAQNGILAGWKRKINGEYHIELNPPLTSSVTLEKGDRLIILSKERI